MNLYVLDTDILSLYQHSHPVVTQRVDARLGGEVAISIISVEEQLMGWYSAIRKVNRKDQLAHAYRRLKEALPMFVRWPALSFTETAIDRYYALDALKLNVGRMDLRIAAIVLENRAILVTRNVRDFSRVPNLVLENWAV